jgi:hypothetical protein
MLLESEHVKAAHNMLVKLTPADVVSRGFTNLFVLQKDDLVSDLEPLPKAFITIIHSVA